MFDKVKAQHYIALATHKSMPPGMLVGKDVTHGEPDVLGLCGLVEELLTLTLFLAEPVPLAAIIYPCPLDINSRGVFHKG